MSAKFAASKFESMPFIQGNHRINLHPRPGWNPPA